MKIQLNIKDVQAIPAPEDLYTGEKFTCTEVVPGTKCNDGGEYGFYKSYIPTKVAGVYMVKTSCTCNFDRCGTGFVGYTYLTNSEVKNLKEESDEIEEKGCLY